MPPWEVYSCFYSLSLRNLLPYKHLLEDLSSALGIKEGESVLDAGCGPGLVIQKLVQGSKGKTTSITGLDLSKRMIEQARRTCRSPNVKLQIADLNRRLDFADDSFDKVVCSNTLYALDNPRSAVSEFHRVLKRGGALIIANPKPKASQKEIIRAHIAATNRVTPVHKKIYRIVTSISLIPVHLVVIAINKAIVDKGRSRSYHFLDKIDLENILREAGFGNTHISSCYADQNWLVRAEKQA